MKKNNLTLLLIAFLSFILSLYLDLFDIVFEFSSSHENWELDEFFSFLWIFSLFLIIFYIFKLRENTGLLKKEKQLSIDLEIKNNELNKTNKELQAAVHKIKTLQGLLPICASCKKIKDEDGNWKEIETYVSDNSDAKFSHSVCPDCMKKLYPEYYDKLKDNNKI